MNHNKKYDWDVIEKDMPTMTNTEISRKYGINKYIIANRRHELQLPKYAKISQYEELLGTMMDSDIARKFNVKRNTVTALRIKRGIPPFITSKEKEMQDELCKSLTNYHQYVRTKVGIIDVIDDDNIYECKYRLTNENAQTAVGQLFIYSKDYPNKKKNIVTHIVLINNFVYSTIQDLGISILVI